jgi:RNA polymerase sigma-70 factor (ECF subfamily)
LLPPVAMNAVKTLQHVSSAASAVELERLFVEYYRWVWRTLRRLGVEEAHVDDAAQHVFFIVSERLSAIDAGRERAFLMGVAVRVASNARRSRARMRERADSEQLNQAAAESNPEELLEWKRRRERLDEWLESLTLELRTPFVLFELERLTLQEIADLLELPLGTVKTRLRKAREIFAAAVETGGMP